VSTQQLYDRESFDREWPALADRLRRTLTARGVPAQDRDDVVQETALRVYRYWTGLDPKRPAWPFVITVGINIWRDVIRERTGRIAQCHPTAHIEMTADLDVERDVLAREEFASTVVAMRSLAPEQRRLLLATEEFGDTARPLRPAERVARMRVRRQLARAVGRASAVVAVFWLRRPGRATGVVATAYAGALAAAVLTSPAIVPMPAVTALPATPAVAPAAHHHAAAAPLRTDQRAARTAHGSHVAATRDVVSAPAVSTPDTASAAPVAAPEVHTKVCTPTHLPIEVAQVMVKLGGTVIYGSDGDGGSQPVASTPPVAVHSGADCLTVN
jgi:DNA-directed RNA polymerase specialized sigma24 family protein